LGPWRGWRKHRADKSEALPIQGVSFEIDAQKSDVDGRGIVLRVSCEGRGGLGSRKLVNLGGTSKKQTAKGKRGKTERRKKYNGILMSESNEGREGGLPDG